MVSLCVVAESSVHNVIYRRIRSHNPFTSYGTIIERLQELESKLDVLFREVGDEVIEVYRQEICQQAERIDPNKNLQAVNLTQIQQDVKSGKELFEAVRDVSSEFVHLAKGQTWGSYLLKYARNHPRGEEVGDKTDRLLNQIIQLGYRCCAFPYETTRQNFKVDPETGHLIERT